MATATDAGSSASRKFLFVSLDGLIGDIAWRVTTEGNEVRYHIANPTERSIADASGTS